MLHLQMAARADGRIGLVWDEISDGVRKIVMSGARVDGVGRHGLLDHEVQQCKSLAAGGRGQPSVERHDFER
jgi:hypothetical protein